MVKQVSNNEIYLLIKYIKSVFCRVAKRLSYIEDARCLKVKPKSSPRSSYSYLLNKSMCKTFISAVLLHAPSMPFSFQ